MGNIDTNIGPDQKRKIPSTWGQPAAVPDSNVSQHSFRCLIKIYDTAMNVWCMTHTICFHKSGMVHYDSPFLNREGL